LRDSFYTYCKPAKRKRRFRLLLALVLAKVALHSTMLCSFPSPPHPLSKSRLKNASTNRMRVRTPTGGTGAVRNGFNHAGQARGISANKK